MSGAASSLAILCLDLDHFKNVNDTLGHPVGDALLRLAAARLRDCVRETDVVARLGGDEFAIVQLAMEQPLGSTALAQRLLHVMSEPFEVDGHQVVIGTSVGIAIAPTDGTEPDQLLKNADMALYRAKADGRNAFRLFEASMDAKMQARRGLELDLRRALVSGEFELYYQPQINLKKKRAQRVGGAAAMESSDSRSHLAGSVHRPGRGDRADRSAWRVGSSAGVRAGRDLAIRYPGGRQSFAGPVSQQEPGRHGACGGCERGIGARSPRA